MKAHELLFSPEKWTKKYFAIDKNEQPVNPASHEAIKWCMMGAVAACYHNKPDEYLTSIKKIETKLEKSIIAFNDQKETSFEEIKQILKDLDI